jgi:hypothetical protein
MRIRLIGVIVAALAVLGWSTSAPAQQTTAKDVGQKMAETGDAIKGYTVEKKDDAVAHAKKLGRDIDGKIKQLEADASKSAAETKAASQEMMKELKAKRAKMGVKMNDLSKATKATWEDTKQGFVDAYKDVAMAYDKAVASIKK